MKAAMKTKPDPTRWCEHLPVILLGIRSTVKDDLSCSPAELVFGTTLRLPAQFVDPKRADVDPSDYVSRLRDHMSQINPTSPRAQSTTTYLPKDLCTCSHVFVRVDRVRKPLEQPYSGPYKVLKRTDKYYTLDINGKREQANLTPCLIHAEHPVNRHPVPVSSRFGPVVFEFFAPISSVALIFDDAVLAK
ncbi:uncharacterized protein [Diadema setosum]|uniref:uncharacterized protein n=1 Tax=Diadema setosum TaxID=31175 RepID=UPI003B3A7D7A